MITRTWKVYGANGHRQGESFNKSYVYDFSNKEDGTRIIEVQNAPKDTPFKVYMYRRKEKSGNKTINEALDGVYGGGKVIGEYVCEKMDEIVPSGSGYMINADRKYANMIANGRTLHISNVKIYDNPKELKEFNLTRPLHDWQYVEDLQ